MRVLADRETVERVALESHRRDRVRDALRFGTIVGGQPLAEFVDRDPELTIHALGRRETVAAEVLRRTVLCEATEIRIQRRVAFRARRHRAVAQQCVHLGATERQRR